MGIGRLRDAISSAANTLKDKVLKHDRNAAGETPIILAIKNNQVEILNKLIDKNPALLSSPDSKGNFLLHEAGRYGQLEILKSLLARLDQEHVEDLGVNTSNNAGETVLHLAARGGFYPVVKEAVNAGAEIGMADYERNSPLHLAALNGHVKVTYYLIDHLLRHFESQYEELSKYVNAQNKAGNTPLHLAVLRGQKETAYALVRKGRADTTIKNDEKETPLQLTEDANFQKDLSILAKTHELTEEGIIINKNVSKDLGKFLEYLKEEKMNGDKQ